ncbi:hypothetical protein BDN70DRAFT_983326 [Pholiota conissans]|uniref:DUF7918 domain-containing protein n=1 Tax=Pholiota conissans TaxID=109636 RepID=A0A9P5Z3K5_9AGAR|nr:hypothetical protein BDN70DRAFT_983326 [Pholiota conissans]
MSTESKLIYKGFEAYISVDSNPLPIIRPVYSEQGAIAWVASEAGKAFSICYCKTLRDAKDYEATVYLDGRQIYSCVHTRRDGNISNVFEISDVRVSPTERKGFIFSKSVLTDDDAHLNNPALSDVGEIKVVLQRFKVTKQERVMKEDKDSKSDGNDFQIHEALKIHEKSKKGLDHQIEYSESITRPKGRRSRYSYHVFFDDLEDPVLSLPKAVLQAERIVLGPKALDSSSGPDEKPTLPRDGENEEVKPIVSLSDNENLDGVLDEMLERERALMAELENIRGQKRAREDTIEASKRVKLEPISHFVPGEVIDLTQ